MSGPEFRKPRQEPMRCEGCDRADAQLRSPAADRLDGSLDPTKGIADHQKEGIGVVGWDDAASNLPDERYAELMLKVGDPVG